MLWVQGGPEPRLGAGPSEAAQQGPERKERGVLRAWRCSGDWGVKVGSRLWC